MGLHRGKNAQEAAQRLGFQSSSLRSSVILSLAGRRAPGRADSGQISKRGELCRSRPIIAASDWSGLGLGALVWSGRAGRRMYSRIKPAVCLSCGEVLPGRRAAQQPGVAEGGAVRTSSPKPRA